LEFRRFVSIKVKHKQEQPTQKHMKKLLTLTGIAGIGAVLALLAACQTTGTGDVVAQKESLLSQSGFKVITVTAPKQQQAVSGLAQGRCSAVTYNGKTYYVFPTATKDKIYVGRQKEFNAYKHALATAYAGHPATVHAQPGQSLIAGQSLMPTLETAGQHNVEVQQFGGFGPMGTASLGDW
jgi:crotonobetainyl-CoA:carnitine CoA-transferase CaiB-like acyl-CoA transferase